MENTPTTTTTTTTVNPNIYRFEGFRYGLRGPDTSGPDDIIPQEAGLYGFPGGDQEETPDV